MRKFILLALFGFVFFGTVNIASTDEGMFPLSELRKLDLRSKGLKIDVNQIYNPNNVSLIDAIVNIGGCSGSFVSAEGMVLTNHHCVFGAVQQVSTVEKDYITHGFLAKTRSEEIPVQGLEVRITESYQDVSKEVLSAISETMSFEERSKALRKKMAEIAAAAEKEKPGKRAEVSEMFQGRSYVLFMYAMFKDVRLVYVPPRSIGEFGGDYDNWEWPRHTGDFSFVRVYVSPDGQPADYAAQNVPYKPKRFLKVNPKGVNEGDFVFLLGYPGRTNRHRSNHFMQYELKRLGLTQALYASQIDIMKTAGESDKSVALKYAARQKSLENVEKRNRGQMLGFERLGLIAMRSKEDAELRGFVATSPALASKYGTMLDDLEHTYAEMYENVERDIYIDEIRRLPLISIAVSIYSLGLEMQKNVEERAKYAKPEELENTRTRTRNQWANVEPLVELKLLSDLLSRAQALPTEKSISAVSNVLRGTSISGFIEDARTNSRIMNERALNDIFGKTAAELDELKDPLLLFAKYLISDGEMVAKLRREREGALFIPSGLYVDARENWLKTAFIPDANRTLRLTYGYIKGYSPRDAVSYTPITTLSGIIEKSRDTVRYQIPRRLRELHEQKVHGKYRHPKLKDVPVAILYNTDTTGGNSGSAVMNANGELIGVNFDRAFEATINDFKWSDSYSRSIAVDVRYILWVTQYIGGAEHLLREMGVPLR